jgi:hypothetical protein
MLVVGCGGGKSDKPAPIEGTAKRVAAVIERLETATRRQDFTTVCNELLADATRRQAGGADCPDVLGQRARGVRRPRIEILSIEIRGNRAQARVRTTATGQAPVTDVISLVRENGRFRILSLGR